MSQLSHRLFDSQNNNRGGYNVGKLYYYKGSVLPIEWYVIFSSFLFYHYILRVLRMPSLKYDRSQQIFSEFRTHSISN